MKKWKYWNKRRWETCWNASLEEPAGFDSRLVTTYILEYSTSCLHMITLDNRADDHVMTIMKANQKVDNDNGKVCRKVPGWFFMFFSRFQVGSSWFQVGFSWFRAVFMFFYGSQWEKPQRYPPDMYLGPKVPPAMPCRPWVPYQFSWSRSGFMISGGFLWLFMVPGWFFIIPGGFYGYSWFHVCFSLFQVLFYGFSWFWVGLYPSWAPEARIDTLRTPQKVPAWSVSWPLDLARKAGFGLVIKNTWMSLIKIGWWVC